MQATQSSGESTITTLNHLIETAKDGESGFEAAAKDCSDPLLLLPPGREVPQCAGIPRANLHTSA